MHLNSQKPLRHAGTETPLITLLPKWLAEVEERSKEKNLKPMRGSLYDYADREKRTLIGVQGRWSIPKYPSI